MGDILRASTLGQPPNHDQRLGLGLRPTQRVTSINIGPHRPSGTKHSCYMPGCGCRLPPLWAKHNHEPQHGAGVHLLSL